MDGRAGVRPKVPATICWHQPTCTVRRYDRHIYILVIILHYRVESLSYERKEAIERTFNIY